MQDKLRDIWGAKWEIQTLAQWDKFITVIL